MAAATGVAKRKAPGPRRDPNRRHTDGVSPWNRIARRDPTRHYVWVNMNSASPEHGPEGYEARGYEIEHKRPDGPEVMGGRTTKDGEPIEMRGNVLMSCTDENYAELERYGEDGGSGQEDADRIEEIIVNKRSGFDPLRGVGVRGRSGQPFVTFENEIQAAQAEGQ